MCSICLCAKSHRLAHYQYVHVYIASQLLTSLPLLLVFKLVTITWIDNWQNAKLSARTYRSAGDKTIGSFSMYNVGGDIQRSQAQFLKSITPDWVRMELQFNILRQWRTHLANFWWEYDIAIFILNWHTWTCANSLCAKLFLFSMIMKTIWQPPTKLPRPRYEGMVCQSWVCWRLCFHLVD